VSGPDAIPGEPRAFGGIDVLVLCGGLGTRLQPVLGGGGGQKALVEIEGRPFLRWLVDDLAREGFRRFVFCAGHRADDVERAAAEMSAEGDLDSVISREPRPLGTAGAIRFAAAHVLSDRFFVVNGDSFCDFSRSAMLEFHLGRGGIGSIALAGADSESDGGFVSTVESGRIVSFREKAFHPSHSFVNAGTYLFERRLLDRIPADRKCSLETEIFPALLEEGLFGFETGGGYLDIGTPERLEVFREYIRGRRGDDRSGEAAQ
jgi:NDP-sugar pyrophosphorylase family protein